MMAMFAFTSVFALQGGPDIYGYTWKDSNEPGGPAFVWNSIQGAPGAVQVAGLADDNSVGPFNLNGWSFHYYWTDESSWKFGSNGWLGFNNIGNIAHCFPTIPQAGGSGDNFIAPYMTDLNFSTNSTPNPGEVWYWDNGADTLIVEWVNVPWWTNGTPDWIGSNSFQLILSGADSSITFMYNDMDQNNFNDTGGCAADLVYGIENITGNIGLQVAAEMVPADQYAIKFYYPDTVTFQVPDATPAWNANADNAGQFFFGGANAVPVDMVTNIANVGNADITNTINVDGELRNLALQQVWSDNSSVPSLVAGADQTVTFGTQATLSTVGQYYYNVSTSNSQDINPSNNDNTVEVSAVDCQNDTVNLTYATGNPPDGVIVWAGAGNFDEGGGVYIEPPAYPFEITAVDAYIVGDGDLQTPMTAGFAITVFDDSAVPGNVLLSDTVQAGQVGEEVWNRVTFSSTATINSGGVYIGWFQGDATIALGTEAFGPISRRTYEILSGSWAPYRQVTVEDFLLSLHGNVSCAVGVEDDEAMAISLNAAPNPTNGITSISYEIPALGDVNFSVMDMYGKTVQTRSFNGLAAGAYAFMFDTNEIASGIYFINMQYGEQKLTKKLVVNR